MDYGHLATQTQAITSGGTACTDAEVHSVLVRATAVLSVMSALELTLVSC